MEEANHEGFSIREYTRNVRSVDTRKCCPFPGEFTGDFIQSLLPPLTVTKFRWWSHELTSLLTKSPDDPKLSFRPNANAESSPCKKRSIVETTTNELALHKKKIKTQKLEASFNAKTDNKVNNCHEQTRERADDDDGKCSLGIKERSHVMSPITNKAGVRCISYTEEEEQFPVSSRSVSQDCDAELQIPGTLSIDASQCERQVGLSLLLCCSQMNRLSLCSAAEDQSPKVMSNDQTSDNMLVESRQLNKFHPEVSERKLSQALAESSMSCFPGPHLTLERIKHALDLERKRHVSQPNQSSSSASLSQHASVAIQFGTLLNQSPSDPLFVEETISRRLTLSLQSELLEENGSTSRSAAEENDTLLSKLVDLSSGRKHLDERALSRYPARLGLDETFTEDAFFISDANDGECGHTTNLPKQQALSQNLSSRHMVANSDGLCLHDTQSTMRLMGKDVSFIDYSFLGSYAQQSWLWQTTTLGEKHSITSLDKPWNTTLLCDTSKDTPFPMFCEQPPQLRTYVVPDSELYPCGSLEPYPSTGRDFYFHESGLGQQLNSVTFSQQQLPFPYNPEIAGLPSYYSNVGFGCLLPDAREPSFGLPFTSTTQSQLHWPHSSF